MKNNATTAIVLDKKRAKKNDKYPVKLRVTYNREPRLYGVNFDGKKYDLTEEEFDKTQLKNPRGNYKDIKLELNSIENKAKKIIDKLPEFSFEEFKIKFYKKGSDLRNVYDYYDTTIKKLEAEGRIGTAGNYSGSLSSIKRFTKRKESLDFAKITVNFLEKYEKWMREQDKSVATIGFYLRPLRAICRLGLKDGVMSHDTYPFVKDKYQIPTKRNKKKSLKLDEIEAIYNYDREEYSSQDMAIDFWVLSYLCNGANIKDLALLKYKNIDSETITFVRAKTERNKKDQEPIIVPLIDEIKDLIRKWGNKDKDPNNYVFPILHNELTPQKQFDRIKGFVKKINNNIKPIAEELNISKKVTTYVARHSFSTVLKRSGASIEFISESLGHGDTKTTQNYLDSFENDVKKEFAAKLTAFKK